MTDNIGHPLVSRTRENRMAELADELRSVEVPEPEVRARPAQPDEIPRGAALMRKVGEEHGWTLTRQTYARGPLMHSTTWRALRVVDSLVIHLSRGPDRLIACWLDGKFAEAWHYQPSRARQRQISSREAHDLLKTSPEGLTDSEN